METEHEEITSPTSFHNLLISAMEKQLQEMNLAVNEVRSLSSNKQRLVDAAHTVLQDQFQSSWPSSPPLDTITSINTIATPSGWKITIDIQDPSNYFNDQTSVAGFLMHHNAVLSSTCHSLQRAAKKNVYSCDCFVEMKQVLNRNSSPQGAPAPYSSQAVECFALIYTSHDTATSDGLHIEDHASRRHSSLLCADIQCIIHCGRVELDHSTWIKSLTNHHIDTQPPHNTTKFSSEFNYAYQCKIGASFPSVQECINRLCNILEHSLYFRETSSSSTNTNTSVLSSTAMNKKWILESSKCISGACVAQGTNILAHCAITSNQTIELNKSCIIIDLRGDNQVLLECICLSISEQIQVKEHSERIDSDFLDHIQMRPWTSIPPTSPLFHDVAKESTDADDFDADGIALEAMPLFHAMMHEIDAVIDWVDALKKEKLIAEQGVDEGGAARKESHDAQKKALNAMLATDRKAISTL